MTIGRILRTACLALAMVLLAAGQTHKVALYAAVGPELTEYDVNPDSAELIKHATVSVPDSIQYAWPHPSGKYIYVGWSNGAGENHHGLSVFRIDPNTGALTPNGEPVTLRWRPVHISLDIPGTHVLVAYNQPSRVSVHQIQADGTIGPEVKQTAQLDTGIYAHQVRVAPSDRMVILVTRGNGPTAKKKEDPGALKVMSYRDGQLTSRQSVAPGGGYGFQPRHVDFAGKWVFVSLERQNELEVYEKLSDEAISDAPLFTKSSLKAGSKPGKEQAASTVHVHPNGKFVYQGNRGMENSIAVWSINSATGEPTLIQNADTRGSTPRTFALDSTGHILVAANMSPKGAVPASLAVFRVRQDGKLDYVKKYDVATTGANTLFWMGIVSLPGM